MSPVDEGNVIEPPPRLSGGEDHQAAFFLAPDGVRRSGLIG